MAKKGFTIKSQALPTAQQAYSVLLGDKSENQIVELPIDLIDEIENQPFKIHQDKIEQIAESMRAVGQLEPVIVVRSTTKEGRYDLIAGRHRKAARTMLGEKTIKAVINSQENPDKQRLILLATNNDRNNDYLPSELAFAYLEQMNIMKKLGYTKTSSAIAEASGTNRKSVHKYIHLTELDKSLLHRVDQGEITVGAGYELSFLPIEKQKKIGLELFNHEGLHIDKKLAQQLRENPDDVKDILLAPKLVNAETKPSALKADTPSSAQKRSEDKKKELDETVPLEIQMTVAATLYHTHYNTLFKSIVCEYWSTEEFIKFFKYKGTGGVHMSSTTNSSPFEEYNNIWCRFTFSAPKVEVEFKFDRFTTYEFSPKDMDYIFRKYLREYVPKEEIIKLIKEG